MIILGIGNVLQKDDGFGIYASSYLKENYIFNEEVEIINGGVEGIKLLSVLEENNNILILDTIELDDAPTSIYLIPAKELSGHGLNAGGAHEIGVIQCLDMIELQGKKLPKATVLGIVPKHVTFDMNLSDTLKEAFDGYIKVALNFLKKEGITFTMKENKVSLESIIFNIRKV
jgi:hydrogenase maturation protease